MAKRGFMDGYKTYQPSTEGYGSEKQWRSDFHSRMGFEEAQEVLKDHPKDTPLGILELSGSPSWNEIKSAYRRLARIHHPDVSNASDALEQMKRINAAYVILERQYGK